MLTPVPKVPRRTLTGEYAHSISARCIVLTRIWETLVDIHLTVIAGVASQTCAVVVKMAVCTGSSISTRTTSALVNTNVAVTTSPPWMTEALVLCWCNIPAEPVILTRLQEGASRDSLLACFPSVTIRTVAGEAVQHISTIPSVLARRRITLVNLYTAVFTRVASQTGTYVVGYFIVAGSSIEAGIRLAVIYVCTHAGVGGLKPYSTRTCKVTTNLR